MYERFTRDARRVLVSAQEEVRELGSEVAGTEHLLLALTRVDALVGDFLHGLGVTHDRLRREVLPGRGAGEVVPLGPDFKAALESAVEHADRLGRPGVGPEHLLLGVLEVGGDAGACLHELGVSALEVRETVLAMAAADPQIEDVAPLFPIARPVAQLEGDVLGRESAEPRCPACRKVAVNAVRHLRVPVDIEVTVDLVYCGWCGHLLTTRIVERG
ncbi:MAG: Clp protease N-terminal domain-containing protein [Acidimicrobiales bacterium]